MTIPAMYNRGPEGQITGVTFYLDFKPHQSDASHAGFPALLVELKSATPDHQRLIALTQPIEAVKTAIADAVAADYLPAGVVGVTSSQVTYNGEPIEGVLAERILTMLAEGFDIMPTVKFLENVSMNPATYAREELYLWLENSNLPITSDGHFLAYKNVRSDFRSYNGGVVDNTPGQIPQMDRAKVNPNRYQTCEAGLHFCSQSYLHMYTSQTGNRVVLLKINPADVVSIPNDYNNAKGRAWKYEVLREVEDPNARVWASVVDPQGEDFQTDDEIAEENELNDFRGELFSAYNRIAEDRNDREARLRWASDILGTTVGSFNDLDITDMDTLIGEAENELYLQEEGEVEAPVADPQLEALLAEEDQIQADKAREDQVAAINSLGIIKLRKLTKKWKGFKAEQLRQILIDQIEG